MAVTLAKNIVFHYVLGAFTGCWDHPVGIDPNASSSHGFSRNGKKKTGLLRWTICANRKIGQEGQTVHGTWQNSLHGEKNKNWSNALHLSKMVLEKGNQHSKALSPIYSFVITHFIFWGTTKRNVGSHSNKEEKLPIRLLEKSSNHAIPNVPDIPSTQLWRQLPCLTGDPLCLPAQHKRHTSMADYLGLSIITTVNLPSQCWPLKTNH